MLKNPTIRNAQAILLDQLLWYNSAAHFFKETTYLCSFFCCKSPSQNAFTALKIVTQYNFASFAS
jgi:hypothetical protein